MMAVQFVLIGAVVATVGFAGWIGYELNIVSSMASLLVSILALADTIHIGTTYLKELKPGVSKKEAVYISLQKNLKAKKGDFNASACGAIVPITFKGPHILAFYRS